MTMGLVDLALCLAAVILAAIAAASEKGKRELLGILSYICCSLAMVLALFDVLARLRRGDAAGVLDIYPTMAWVYLAVLGIVTALHLFSIRKKRGR